MKKEHSRGNVIKWICASVFFGISLVWLYYSLVCFVCFEFAIYEYFDHGKLITSNSDMGFFIFCFLSFISNIVAVMFRRKKVIAIILFVLITAVLVILYVKFASMSKLIGEEAFRWNYIHY